MFTWANANMLHLHLLRCVSHFIKFSVAFFLDLYFVTDQDIIELSSTIVDEHFLSLLAILRHCGRLKLMQADKETRHVIMAMWCDGTIFYATFYMAVSLIKPVLIWLNLETCQSFILHLDMQTHFVKSSSFLSIFVYDNKFFYSWAIVIFAFMILVI